MVNIFISVMPFILGFILQAYLTIKPDFNSQEVKEKLKLVAITGGVLFVVVGLIYGSSFIFAKQHYDIGATSFTFLLLFVIFIMVIFEKQFQLVLTKGILLFYGLVISYISIRLLVGYYFLVKFNAFIHTVVVSCCVISIIVVLVILIYIFIKKPLPLHLKSFFVVYTLIIFIFAIAVQVMDIVNDIHTYPFLGWFVLGMVCFYGITILVRCIAIIKNRDNIPAEFKPIITDTDVTIFKILLVIFIFICFIAANEYFNIFSTFAVISIGLVVGPLFFSDKLSGWSKNLEK
jgi:hypothetical protein